MGVSSQQEKHEKILGLEEFAQGNILRMANTLVLPEEYAARGTNLSQANQLYWKRTLGYSKLLTV
jgi:hypothetical protein